MSGSRTRRRRRIDWDDDAAFWRACRAERARLESDYERDGDAAFERCVAEDPLGFVMAAMAYAAEEE